MKYLFYISIITSVGIVVVILIERNKKPSNLLIQDNQANKNETTTDSNLQGNKSQNLK
jgi:preprotein translocase subunit SecG